jgi:predicted membrane chloride channel (bestrophin family)
MIKTLELEAPTNLPSFMSAIAMETVAYGGFSTILGFVVVFRTSEAYTRFCDGSKLTHQMRGDWFDACSGLVSYSRWTQGSVDSVHNFRHLIVRLFSMLHALALADLEDAMDQDGNRWAFTLDLIDPTGLDEDSLLKLKQSETKVELIYFWIQGVIVEAQKERIIDAPAPIVTRAWSELASGMLRFHECLKIANVPLPFPYSQTTWLLLVLHWMVTPLMMCSWTVHPAMAGTVAFVQAFVLWSLHAIALELENPFGADINDLNVREMNADLQRKFMMLLEPASNVLPTLSKEVVMDHGDLQVLPCICFQSIWDFLNPMVSEGSVAKVGRLREQRRRRSSARQLRMATVRSSALILSRAQSQQSSGKRVGEARAESGVFGTEDDGNHVSAVAEHKSISFEDYARSGVPIRAETSNAAHAIKGSAAPRVEVQTDIVGVSISANSESSALPQHKDIASRAREEALVHERL